MWGKVGSCFALLGSAIVRDESPWTSFEINGNAMEMRHPSTCLKYDLGIKSTIQQPHIKLVHIPWVAAAAPQQTIYIYIYACVYLHIYIYIYMYVVDFTLCLIHVDLAYLICLFMSLFCGLIHFQI